MTTRQSATVDRLTRVSPRTQALLRGAQWAPMVQTLVAGARTRASQATEPHKLSDIGTVPGVTDPEGAGVRPSRQETKEVTESTEARSLVGIPR